MQAIDFNRFLDTKAVDQLMPQGALRVDGIYHCADGLQMRIPGRDGELVQETVRISDHALLFASDFSPGCAQRHRQLVSESDLIHIQFRLSGGGRENISQQHELETPDKCCIVARYPRDSVIDRTIDKTNSWKVACLLVSPKGLTDLLQVSAAQFPESAAWMARAGALELQSSVFPLPPAMVMAVNDIIACPFRNGNRRAYMRAKSLELLSTVIHTLDSAARASGQQTVKLSAADRDKIASAHVIMTQNLDGTQTLAELAGRVGLNRTKLALGFKQIYGISVQAYWRDAKLGRARELLRDGSARVTEVALNMGYSELSSFTRAFSRKFGVLPRECKAGSK